MEKGKKSIIRNNLHKGIVTLVKENVPTSRNETPNVWYQINCPGDDYL